MDLSMQPRYLKALPSKLKGYLCTNRGRQENAFVCNPSNFSLFDPFLFLMTALKIGGRREKILISLAPDVLSTWQFESPDKFQILAGELFHVTHSGRMDRRRLEPPISVRFQKIPWPECLAGPPVDKNYLTIG